MWPDFVNGWGRFPKSIARAIQSCGSTAFQLGSLRPLDHWCAVSDYVFPIIG
jgi:hypothetical protein